MNTDTNSKCVEVCNSLLRGEISAVESYEQAINKFDGKPGVATLKTLRDTHWDSADLLKEQIKENGGEPSDQSGVWGTVTGTIQATANLFGKDSTVESLITGEEHGRRTYEETLANPEVAEECKEIIRTELLPRVTANTTLLHELQAST